MIIPTHSKRTPPPPQQGTFSLRLTPAGPLLAVFAASLLLIACPSPGGGETTNPSVTPVTAPKTYTTTVSGTVTASPPGESSSINLPGAKVSALTTPPSPANKPTTAGPDGRFTLEVKHPGTFQLKVENTCYDPFTSAPVSASADGSHNAGAISLTLKPEPTGTARYSITQKSPGSYKLTVKECVRAIGNNEFSAVGTIITNVAAAEGVAFADRNKMITELALPSTLRSIGEKGFSDHGDMSGTFTIPRNVETLAKEAFRNLGSATAVPTVVFETGSKLTTIGDSGFLQSSLNNFTFPENLETIEAFAFFKARFSFSADFSHSGTLIIPSKVSKIGNRAFRGATGITAVDIRSDRLARPAGATTNLPLGNNLFENVTGITEITLPQAVYEDYTKAQLQGFFGSSFTNYRKPNGTAYDFAAKL